MTQTNVIHVIMFVSYSGNSRTDFFVLLKKVLTITGIMSWSINSPEYVMVQYNLQSMRPPVTLYQTHKDDKAVQLFSDRQKWIICYPDRETANTMHWIFFVVFSLVLHRIFSMHATFAVSFYVVIWERVWESFENGPKLIVSLPWPGMDSSLMGLGCWRQTEH